MVKIHLKLVNGDAEEIECRFADVVPTGVSLYIGGLVKRRWFVADLKEVTIKFL